MTNDRFQRAFALLRVHEGGYSDHPRDPGGATMKGVTQRTYDSYRRRRGQPTKHVKQITDGEVERIYRKQYWNAVQADDLPDGVAYCVFDAAVNSGPGQAVEWLQRVVGARADGIVGNETISKTRDKEPEQIIDAYCDMRLAFMKRLSHWSTFKNGWSDRVAEVRAQSREWADQHAIGTETQAGPPAKAEGPESNLSTAKGLFKDKSAIAAASGLLGSAGSLASGNGPIQYAVAGVLILGALAGIWWLVRGRHE